MREFARIKRVITLLQSLWEALPDYRFWQVINALEIPERLHGSDPFFWEDDVWEQIFKQTLEEIGK